MNVAFVLSYWLFFFHQFLLEVGPIISELNGLLLWLFRLEFTVDDFVYWSVGVVILRFIPFLLLIELFPFCYFS